MTDNASAEEKSIVTALNFGSKTTKRVTWEAWEFSVAGPHQIRVTNASWGYLKADHSYIVGVEERDGRLIPAECGCKADRFRDNYDCKHKVALATVGGPLVLKAATEYSTPGVDTEETPAPTLEERLRTDGGVVAEDSPSLDAVEQGCDCDDLTEGFPCWPCVRDGKQELPE